MSLISRFDRMKSTALAQTDKCTSVIVCLPTEFLEPADLSSFNSLLSEVVMHRRHRGPNMAQRNLVQFLREIASRQDSRLHFGVVYIFTRMNLADPRSVLELFACPLTDGKLSLDRSNKLDPC